MKALEAALGNPERPVAAVIGGATVSTKLEVLAHLVGKVDHLIIGGGMANTFLAARGIGVGKIARRARPRRHRRRLSSTRRRGDCTVHLPYDVVVAKEFAANPPSLRTCNVHEVAADEMILDIGPAAVEAFADVLKTCRTLVWNGPLGAFETPPFDAATVALARTAAALTQEGSLVSVAGGGDTVAALNHAGVAAKGTPLRNRLITGANCHAPADRALVDPENLVDLVNLVNLADLAALQRNLNCVLLMPNALMRWSSVDGGTPSFAAAPELPATRPRHSASAASMISRSPRASPGRRAGAATRGRGGTGCVDSQAGSTAKTSPELTITDRSITFCSSRMLPGQS